MTEKLTNNDLDLNFNDVAYYADLYKKQQNEVEKDNEKKSSIWFYPEKNETRVRILPLYTKMYTAEDAWHFPEKDRDTELTKFNYNEDGSISGIKFYAKYFINATTHIWGKLRFPCNYRLFPVNPAREKAGVCPFCQLRNNIYAQLNANNIEVDKASPKVKELLKSVTPSQRFLLNVYVYETKEIKIWSIDKDTKDRIESQVKMYLETGNHPLDPRKGHDFSVLKTKKQVKDKKYDTFTTSQFIPVPSALASNDNDIMDIVKKQHNLIQVFKKYYKPSDEQFQLLWGCTQEEAQSAREAGQKLNPRKPNMDTDNSGTGFDITSYDGEESASVAISKINDAIISHPEPAKVLENTKKAELDDVDAMLNDDISF